MKLVRVDWVDSAFFYEGWKDVNDHIYKLEHCVSVGFVIKETKKKIVLCPHYISRSKHGCGEMAIPKSAIRKIRKLK